VTDRIADRVVVNCEAMRRHLIEDENVPPERIILCYNGVDTRVFHPPVNRTRPERLSGVPLVIGSVCALREEKRLDLLVEAFARVRHLQPGMKLLITGSGVLLSELVEQAKRLDIAEDCIFEPATGDVVPWMHAIDIFVLPSRSEAFSNSLLEAMACGCAPVAARVGGLPELVAHGQNGLLFEPGNAGDLAEQLRQLIPDEQLRHRFGRASARRAREEFSIERAVQTMSNCYTELTAGKSGGRSGHELSRTEDDLLRTP
jgi:glycosyltransferase involved in cell wall biosynthesis